MVYPCEGGGLMVLSLQQGKLCSLSAVYGNWWLLSQTLHFAPSWLGRDWLGMGGYRRRGKMASEGSCDSNRDPRRMMRMVAILSIGSFPVHTGFLVISTPSKIVFSEGPSISWPNCFNVIICLKESCYSQYRLLQLCSCELL